MLVYNHKFKCRSEIKWQCLKIHQHRLSSTRMKCLPFETLPYIKHFQTESIKTITASASKDKGRTKTLPKPSQLSHMAIGSEIKSANQMKNMPWCPINQQKNPILTSEGDLFSNMLHLSTQRCHSPFDVGTGFGFNGDFFDASNRVIKFRCKR